MERLELLVLCVDIAAVGLTYINETIVLSAAVECDRAVDVLLLVNVKDGYDVGIRAFCERFDKFGYIHIQTYCGKQLLRAFDERVAVDGRELFPVVETNVAFETQCRRIRSATPAQPIPVLPVGEVYEVFLPKR